MNAAMETVSFITGWLLLLSNIIMCPWETIAVSTLFGTLFGDMFPWLRSTYSITPPSIGRALVSSPNTAQIGSKSSAHSKNASMAGMGPPLMMIHSPTKKIQPVPMIAPNPIVKKFQSVNVFDIFFCLTESTDIKKSPYINFQTICDIFTL